MSSHIPSPPSSSAASSPASGASFLAVLPSRQRCTSSDGAVPSPKRSRYCNIPYGTTRADASVAPGGVDYSSHIPTPATTPAFRSFHTYEDATSARQQVSHRPFVARTSSFPLATSRTRSSTTTVVPCPVLVVEAAQTAEDVEAIEDTNRNPERRAGRRATESHVTFVPQASTKESLVAGLVGASVLAIESIWGSPPASSGTTPAASEAAILPLRFFVTEVLRRSRTSCSTLQVALYYLHKARREIREAVTRASVHKQPIVASTYPSPPLSPIDRASARHPYESNDSVAIEEEEKEENSPVLCGRRMFLASLIAASKFLQDRNYSNRAWAKISGLPIASINANERVFLGLIDFQLHVGAREFAKWTERLAAISSVEMQRTCASIGTQRAADHSSPPSPPIDVAQATTIDIPVTGCPADAGSLTTRVGKPTEAASAQLPSPADSSDESVGRQRHVRALPRRPLSRSAMLVD